MAQPDLEQGGRFVLKAFGGEREVKVEAVKNGYVTYSSLGQLSARSFSSQRVSEFLTKAHKLLGYRFTIPATLGTEEIVIEAPTISEARRAATERGKGRARYAGYAYAS